MEAKEDKKILGAGISGLVAAINLAREGYPVDVYERNDACGMRFHGDMQGLENNSEKTDILEELQGMNIDINFDHYPLHGTILTDGKKSKELHFKRPRHYVVKRGPAKGTLDYGLKEQALEAGVKIRFKETIPPEEADIVATGPVHGATFGVAKGIIFESDLDNVSITIFNDDMAYKGYSYLLIFDGYGCMCSVVMDDLPRITRCFEKTKEYYINEYDLEIRSPKPVGGVAGFTLQNRYNVNGTLYVGEAAGLQDLTAGYGMRLAARSGYLAARSMIEGFDYAEAAQKRFRNHLRISMIHRYLYEHVLPVYNKGMYVDLYSFFSGRDITINRYTLMHRLLYPLSLSYLKKKYPLESKD